MGNDSMNKQLVKHLSESEIDSHTVQNLRTFFLDLAIRGKLVSSRTTNNSSGIHIKQKITQKIHGESGGLPPISNEEIPFNLPDTWVWCRFGSILDIKGGSQPPKSKFSDKPGKGLIRLYQIRDLGTDPIPVYIPEELAKSRCTENDVLLARYGASVGKIFMGRDGSYNVALTKLLFDRSLISERFLFHLLKSDIFQKHLSGSSRMAQAGFNKGNLNPILLPIPPLEEQNRIAKRVDELIEILDCLQEAVEEKNLTLVKLREALITEALESI